MASNFDFLSFVIEQIKNAGEISYKKMFGEYTIYSNKKPIFLVCDNIVYVKILPCVKPFLANAQTGIPYKGAKEHYIVDIDDSKALSDIARAVEKVTPIPKLKKKPLAKKKK
ncbi:MAG: TfoX/Sxy family protein [Elusimicrobiota bacterium]|jgi:TfoX/Sxy family transcriptional regulator of competence genes|nr:TfoX/Sxy family protein [Elusimicrobiota bacterium]